MSILNHVSWLEGSFPVRQTVAFGPDSSGAPNFLPASGASLTLTGQNVTSGVPLVISAAQGYNKEGTIDVNYTFTTNPVWASLTASSTLYLYVNTATGATGFTTLVPIYQYGGTPAVTTGQFTFNYGTMTGFMGNGTTAPATPIVFVGELVTGASTITSTIAYAYNGFYDSGFTTTLPALATVITKNSNLGTPESTPFLIVECVTTEGNWAVGDRVAVTGFNGTDYISAPTFTSRNTVGFGTSPATSPFFTYSKTTSARVAMTAANWKYKLIAKRVW